MKCLSNPEMGVVYPRFANTYTRHYLFPPDSLLLEWEMRKSELVCFTVALWMESGIYEKGYLCPVDTYSLVRQINIWQGAHFFWAPSSAKCFQRREEKILHLLKDQLSFCPRGSKCKWNGRREPSCIITWGSTLQVLCIPSIIYPQAVPQQSHFSDEQTGPIRVNRLSQDHIHGHLLSWHRLIPEPSFKSLAFYTTPKHANACLHLHLPLVILALLEFFS